MARRGDRLVVLREQRAVSQPPELPAWRAEPLAGHVVRGAQQQHRRVRLAVREQPLLLQSRAVVRARHPSGEHSTRPDAQQDEEDTG